MEAIRAATLEAKIEYLCREILEQFVGTEAVNIEKFLLELVERAEVAPATARGISWREISRRSHVDYGLIVFCKRMISPALEAIAEVARDSHTAPSSNIIREEVPATISVAVHDRDDRFYLDCSPKIVWPYQLALSGHLQFELGTKDFHRVSLPNPDMRELRIAETGLNSDHQSAAFSDQAGPSDAEATFGQALKQAIIDHHDSCERLWKKLTAHGFKLHAQTIENWRNGQIPKRRQSYPILHWIAEHYGYDRNYFVDKIQFKSYARFIGIHQFEIYERHIVAWHLPDDFNDRSEAERKRIFEWISGNVFHAPTDYSLYASEKSKQHFILKFPGYRGRPAAPIADDACNGEFSKMKPSLIAPARLAGELDDLIAFKSRQFAREEMGRIGSWSDASIDIARINIGIIFGSLAAPSEGPVRGKGIPAEKLTLALLLFPKVWDWFLLWRSQRRGGFYVVTEVNMIHFAVSILRKKTGWLRQSSHLAAHLSPIPGWISPQEIERVRASWSKACDKARAHLMDRATQISEKTIEHRDSSESLKPVLESQHPYDEYLKIAAEIQTRMGETAGDPVGAAELVRSFLIIRFGLHLCLRQKNFRELLVCLPGEKPRPAHELYKLKRGEIRFNVTSRKWEVFIPLSAFKNHKSSFFDKNPYHYVLEDVGDLYKFIQIYLDLHRKTLLANAADPGTFFVRTIKKKCRTPTYSLLTFNKAWTAIIQRFGIQNPFTGRGAIAGIFPHGPHCVRDVVAIHILNETNNPWLAGYAIQDTPETVLRVYGKRLPKQKLAIAAEILNQAWQRKAALDQAPDFLKKLQWHHTLPAAA